MNERIFLGLGSNVGKGYQPLLFALESLKNAGIRLIRASSIFKTPPWGKTDQPDFFNQVLEVSFEGTAMELLAICMETELALGRIRTVQWGPRTIDIDLLAFGNQMIASQRLTVPHPMLAARAFVLVPWAEVSPEFEVPGHLATVSVLLSRIPTEERDAIHPVNAEQ